MAIKSTPVFTRQAQSGARGFGSRASSADVSASMRWATFTYTVDGLEVSGDTINFGMLMGGVIVIPDMAKISTDGVGGTAAINTLGDNLVPTRYSATPTAVATAGSIYVTPTNAQLVVPVAVIETNETLIGSLTFASPLTVGKKIVLRIPYLTVI